LGSPLPLFFNEIESKTSKEYGSFLVHFHVYIFSFPNLLVLHHTEYSELIVFSHYFKQTKEVFKFSKAIVQAMGAFVQPE
jgi:hypothetical protein